MGGQGKDGHDRIHLATSKDGKDWKQAGTIFAPEGADHVNDSPVVSGDGVLYMFYTLAGSGATGSIGLATSVDGRKWSDRGAVFAPNHPLRPAVTAAAIRTIGKKRKAKIGENACVLATAGSGCPGSAGTIDEKYSNHDTSRIA